MKAIRIRSFGDILIHAQLYKAAEVAPGVYDFSGMFDPIKSLVQGADISVVNQETVLVQDPSQVSSFPLFGSPKEISDAIADAGFNVVTQASNHAIDKGYEGIAETLCIWRDRHPKILVLGFHSSDDDGETIPIVEIKGAKIALLNFTEKLNLRYVPKSKRPMLDTMKSYSKKKVFHQLEKARAEADFVVAFPHWGGEYLPPSKDEYQWAQLLADHGADLIIGTHPHVLQPLDVVASKDGRIVPCYYSLGNLISCQVHQATMVGGMADVLLQVSDEGKVSVESADLIPLVTHTNEDYSEFAVYPLSSYPQKLAEKNKIFKMVEKNFGRPVDRDYLIDVYAKSQKGETIDGYVFHSHWDVLRGNLKGVVNAIQKKNTKG